MNKNLIKILSRLTLLDLENITKEILIAYEQKEYCIVHFLYFANIILSKLDKNDDISPKKEALSKALLAGDFLLPDGIALKLLYKKYFRKELPNLNGTDFLPYFFTHLPYGKKVEILLYGATDEVVKKSVEYITKTFGYPIISVQNGFTEFDWSTIPTRQDGTIRILLIGR